MTTSPPRSERLEREWRAALERIDALRGAPLVDLDAAALMRAVRDEGEADEAPASRS